jgi:nanoRNase/pAp phosphatase (c-di-AMP/oligoRNAs hydrolase)
MSRSMSASQANGRSVSRRSDRFLAGLAQFRSVTFVSHVQPDPDSLASMMGLAHLIDERLGIPTRLTRDGEICRAENRAMVDILDIDLVPIEDIVWHDSDAVVMVDSQPRTGRHSFLRATCPIYAVIDHHQTPGDLDDIAFLDIRQDVGATCSIVTQYLMEHELEIPERIATALLYGIETEVCGFPREANRLDDTALQHLHPLANKDYLAKIKNTPLPESFFEALLQALQSSFIYDDRLLISWINDLPMPELAAQVVDFLVRYEKIDWAICAGVCGNQMILSCRTAHLGAEAGEVMRQVVSRLGGKAGGHDRRAGGAIPLASTSASAIEQAQADFRRRLLKTLQIEDTRGRRLVSPKEMLQNMV